jgi:hypothetical protein
MDRAEFWKLLENIDRRALRRFDEEAAVEPLIKALAKRDEREIFGFEEQLAQVLHDLDGRVYADHAGESSGSDDAFLYARCFVVASGEMHYGSVLASPAAMPRTLDEWCESLLGVGAQAWALKTGRDEEDWDFDTSVSFETGSNKAKWR